MAFKVVAILALVAVVSAQYSEHSHHEEEHYGPAKYDFEYSVHDEHTGDIKSQKESREGDVVHGSYSLIDADGYRRTVDYTADKHSGFNAIVHREPLGHKLQEHKVVAAPVYHAAPVVHQVVSAAPVYHAAPVVHKVVAAPVVHNVVSAPVYHAAPVVHSVVAPVQHKVVTPLVHYAHTEGLSNYHY